MFEMLETYTMPSCLTPIHDTTPEPQSPRPPSPITGDEEILWAVASTSVVENETFAFCINGTDMAEDVLSDLEEENISDEIVEAVVTESVKDDVEKEIVRKEEELRKKEKKSRQSS